MSTGAPEGQPTRGRNSWESLFVGQGHAAGDRPADLEVVAEAVPSPRGLCRAVTTFAQVGTQNLRLDSEHPLMAPRGSFRILFVSCNEL